MLGNLKTAAFSQGIHEVSDTAKERVGCLRIDALGRKFRYAKAGAGALAAGKMTQAPAAVANHVNKQVAAAAIGDVHVYLTVGNTAVTENQYEGGFLMVNDGTGEGHCCLIASNTACAGNGTTMLTLEEPLKVALVAGGTTEASLILSPWAGVVHSDVEENVPTGVPLVPIPIGYYGWLQTGGVCNVLEKGTPAVGTMLTFADVAGALAAINATLDIDQPVLARQYATAGVDTEYKPVQLMID